MKPIVELPIQFSLRARQAGATLITALVMLVVLTLLVISAMNSSTVHLRIAGNMQIKEEAIAAAQQATEQVMSNNFTDPLHPPASSVSVPIGGTTYAVAIAQPTCTASTPMRNNYPNLPVECLSSGGTQNSGIFFASGVQAGASWCLAQTWEVNASVTDARTGAAATTHQGVAIKVPIGTNC